jgi:hypothetical protein
MNRNIAKACIFGGLILTSIMISVAFAQTPVPVKVIETGTLAGQAITWVAAVFSIPVAGVITTLLVRMMNNAGIVGANLLSDKLNSIVLNGLNSGAAEATTALAGKGQIEIKNAAVASAITYVQDHGADTLKALGVDPTSPAAIDAIKARIATAIVDPNMPTHPVLAAAGSPAAWPSTSPNTTG